jgi:GTP-binding protein Era
MTEQVPAGFRSGYVAIVGPPNAGKSTLLNRLLGAHLAAVAPRPQTTRHRILGVHNRPGYQMVFLDTPGLLDPAYPLQKYMKREITRAVSDADLVLLVLDATRGPAEFDGLTRTVAGKKGVVVLNKVDLVKEKARLLESAAGLARAGLNDVFMVSAINGSGTAALEAAIVGRLPEAPPLFPPDAIAERDERFFTAEFIREAVFNLYGEEIPYSTTVVIEEFRERPGRKDYIRATIYVERESQRAIVIGQDGRALKRAGSTARRSIERFLGRGVYLELWVKVALAWRKDEGFIRQNIYGRQT